MPIFTALATGIAAAGTWFAGLGLAGQFIVRTVVGVGLSAIANKLAGKPGGIKRSVGVTGQIQQGADLSRSFLLGRVATAGSLAYHSTWGKAGKTPNAYYTMVVALSDIPVSGLAEVWVDGVRCTLDTGNTHADYGDPLTEYRVNGTDHAWIKFYDGTQVAADAFLTGTVSSVERPWPVDAIGVGVAYAIATFRINGSLFTALPRVVFECDGITCYNPATGLDEAGTANPIAHIWQIISGVNYGGTTLFGLQNVPYLALSDWQPAAQTANVAVPGGASMSSTEKIFAFGYDGVPAQYEAGLEIVCRDDDPGDVIEDLLAACSGRIAYNGATYKIQSGAYGAAAMTFTDDDIVSTSQQQFTPILALDNSINTVVATHPDRAQAWQAQTTPPLSFAADIAEDGGRVLSETVELQAVSRREQAQRVMAAALKEARRARKHTITMPPSFWVLEPMDVVEWTSARNGYAAKQFRIDGVYDLPSGDVVLDITEVDPADYSWDASTDVVSFDPGGTDQQVVPAQTVGGFAVTGVVIADATSGQGRPAISVQWDGTVEDVLSVQIEIRHASTLQLVHTGQSADVASGEAIISAGILSDVGYEARAKYNPGSARDTAWTAWTAVTSPAHLLDTPDIADQAITVPSDAQGSNETKITDSHTFASPLSVVSLAVTTSGARAEVAGQCQLSNREVQFGADNRRITAALYVDGVYYEGFGGRLYGQRDWWNNVSFIKRLSLAAGAHTFEIRVFSENFSGSTEGWVYYPVITVNEVKK